MDDVHRAAAEGYARGAQTYASGRPGFPPASLVWLQQDLRLGPGKVAVELGAGTGKFTRVIASTGAAVVAVEPVAEMLHRLASDLPGVSPLRASAQELPLAAQSADAVVCAQSFHWFANTAALAEIQRVLKPGGVLGLIWNVRDRSVPWVDALARLVDAHEGDAPRYDNDEWRHLFPADGFTPLEERSVPHAHVGSAEQVIVERTASVSFIAALHEDQRRKVIEEVRALIRTTPQLAGTSDVRMPYETKMYWCKMQP